MLKATFSKDGKIRAEMEKCLRFFLFRLNILLYVRLPTRATHLMNSVSKDLCLVKTEDCSTMISAFQTLDYFKNNGKCTAFDEYYGYKQSFNLNPKVYN